MRPPFTPPPFRVSHIHGPACRFMEIIECICMGNPLWYFLQQSFFEFLCIKTTFWITRIDLLSNFASAPKCFFLPKSDQAGRAKQDFRVEHLPLRVKLTSPPLRIIRIPGVGRQPVSPGKGRREEGAEAVLSPRLASRRWRVWDQGWTETAGEHQENQVQHGASPGRPLRRAL